MKKVKIMLTGVVVFAILGGVFAFKAKKIFGTTIFTTVGNFAPAAGACTVQNIGVTTTMLQPLSQPQSVYYTVQLPGSCITPTHVYTIPKL